MIKLLTFSSLFPNAITPHHGVFVENRLRYLVSSGEVTSKVVAPVPWFPFRAKIFGQYAEYATVPARESRYGLSVDHPRYLVIPKFGMNLTPNFMYKSSLPVIRNIIENGYDFDVLDAHYFYPDGVAAVKIARALNKPVTITARGTDLNLIPQYSTPRRMIQWAASQADGIVTVCQALKDSLIELGVDSSNVEVRRNGVDLDTFVPPVDRENLRTRLEMNGRVILSVGHLIERKGHHIVIEALAKLPDVALYIAGQGPELGRLKRLAVDSGVSDRVTFLGAIPHDQLKEFYGAVDMLVLASSREGWANVLLESMACGTPVVATSIWGTPEVVASGEAGQLVDDRTPAGIADGIKRLYEKYPNRAKTRAYAERFSWDDTTRGLINLYKRVLK